MIWAVCGAGRGVGKTTVARSITDSLESSVYCKFGHNAPKPGKPENFFGGIKALDNFIDIAAGRYGHVVVESNSFVYSERPDITIYIDGVEGKTDFRRDCCQLKAEADIKITQKALPENWERVLLSKLSDNNTVYIICRCLLRQQKWLYSGENTYA